MAFTKYASLENVQILELKGSSQRARHASLGKLADFHQYRTDDGFLYARIRAISSRVNKNHDGWPSIELAGGQDVFDRHHSSADGFTVTADRGQRYGFSTFLGKPIFVDHHNSDPSRARGVIVDSMLHVDDHKTASLDPYYSSPDVDSEHLPGTWIELLLEVDAKAFPKFAKAIVEGSRDPRKGIDGWSMGCDVERSVCSICKNSASSPEDYCDHIRMKGAMFKPKGSKTAKRAYENCYGVTFFEISGVFDPADETALSRGVVSKTQTETIIQDPKEKGLKDLADEQADNYLEESERNKKKHKGAIRLAENPPPQGDLLHAPEKIDTLREEEVCPVCGSSMDEDTCDVCGYQEPPEGFGNPDLTKARDGDDNPMEPNDPRIDIPHDTPEQAGSVPESTPNTPSNTPALAHVTSDMAWEVHHTAARINQIEKPHVATDKPATNEPKEQILADQLAPVTSNVRTAEDFIAAVAYKENNQMSTRKVADSAPPSNEPRNKGHHPMDDVRSPEKVVDVLGVGGVMDATNEQAGKANAQIDVTGIGGTGIEGVASDQEGVNVEQGDEHSKNIEAIHTDTWGPSEGDSLGQQDPVTSEVPEWVTDSRWSHWRVEGHEDGPLEAQEQQGGGTDLQGGGAAKGVKPIAEQFGERVDVLQPLTSPANNSGPTTTWTGTDGNGVLKQQDPVTGESIALSESGLEGKPNWSTTSHIFAAFKLADLEVELGMLPEDRKYARAAELEKETPTRLAASLEYAQRVRKTAKKVAGVQKLPVMGRPTPTKEASIQGTPAAVTEDDSFMFGGL